MPFDQSKIGVPPDSPHVVWLRIQVAAHGKLPDGQLHGVAAKGPEVLSFEIPCANAPIARQKMCEVVEHLRSLYQQ